MKIKNIKLTGSIGIQNGLGINELEINFANKGNVVALTGDNGIGKSTVINFLNPFIDSSVYGKFGKDGGSLKLEFVHNSITYLSDIKIQKTEKTQKTTAYLMQDNNGEWEKTKHGDIICDGKISVYNEVLSSKISKEFFLKSCVFSQKHELLTEKDPKSLISSILGLDKYDLLIEGTKEELKEIHNKKTEKEVDILLESIDRNKQDILNTNSNISEQEEELKKTNLLIETLEKDIKNITASKIKLESENTNALLQKDIESQNIQLETKKEEEEKITAEISALQTQEKNLYVTLSKQRDSRIEKANLLSSKFNRVDQLASLVSSQKEIEQIEQQLNALQVRMEESNISLNKKKEAGFVLQTKKEEGRNQAEKLKSAKTTAELVEKVPCKGEGDFSTCPLLLEAISCKKAIFQIEDSLKKLRDNYADLKSQYDKIESEENLKNDIQKIQTEKTQKNNQLAELKQKETDFNKKEIETTKLNTEKAALDSEIKNLLENIKKTNISIDNIKEELKLLDKTKKENEEKIKSIEQKITELKNKLNTGQSQKIQELERDINTKEAELKNNRELKSQKEASVNESKFTEKSLQTKKIELENKKKETDYLEKEEQEWKLTQKCIASGMNIKLEEAVFRLEDITNNLLLETYGDKFSIYFQTQKELKNKNVRDSFDIIVRDNTNDSEGDMNVKSGGEKVWLNLCLTLAIIQYQSEINPEKYSTIIMDELDDGLSEENKEKFFRLLNIISTKLDLTIIFVSHYKNSSVFGDTINFNEIITNSGNRKEKDKQKG